MVFGQGFCPTSGHSETLCIKHLKVRHLCQVLCQVRYFQWVQIWPEPAVCLFSHTRDSSAHLLPELLLQLRSGNGFKRSRSPEPVSVKGTSPNLADTLERLWTRTQSGSAHAAPIAAAESESSQGTHVGSSGHGNGWADGFPPAVTEDSALQNGCDESFANGRARMARIEAETDLLENLFGDKLGVQLGKDSSRLDEDFFRGLENLNGAFEEIGKLLPGNEQLATAAAIPDGGELDLWNDLMDETLLLDDVATSAQPCTPVAVGGGRGSMMRGQPPSQATNDSSLLSSYTPPANASAVVSSEELHAQESLQKLNSECTRRKANSTRSNSQDSSASGGHIVQQKRTPPLAAHFPGEGNPPLLTLLINVAKAVVAGDQARVHQMLEDLRGNVRCLWKCSTARVSLFSARAHRSHVGDSRNACQQSKSYCAGAGGA